jgi:hypothetical protein
MENRRVYVCDSMRWARCGHRSCGCAPRHRQCKWGRHCCRPHSHQRVDALNPALSPANLRLCLRQRILGARCLFPARPTLRLVSFDLRRTTGVSGFRHRRSHRHPAFAPALPRSSSARKLRFPLPCAFAQPRPRSFTDPGHCALPACADCTLSFSARSPGLSDETASRSSQTSLLAFGRSLLHAVSR